MITKEKKHEIVAELKDKLQGVKGFYLVDFAGMTVAQSIKFRRQLKEKNIGFKVAKNTLINIALKESGVDFTIPDEKFAGASAIMVGYDDATAAAKILRDYLEKEKQEKPALKAAVIEGQYFDGSQLKTVADLPTREDMIAAILGSLNAPASGIVGTINAVMRDVASLIEEVAKKKAA